MNLSPLTALSPLDGRYHEKTLPLRMFFSEYALMRYRVFVEIQWFQCMQPELTPPARTILEEIVSNFGEKDAEEIKYIERTTNHDVKAVEYFIKQKIASCTELHQLSEWVHFGCTSEDINNLAYGLMVKNARDEILLPMLDKMAEKLQYFAHQYAGVSMLSRTHGQKATPTTAGKEFANVLARINHQKANLARLKIWGKINGAVGNFNAHRFVLPEKNWLEIAKNFIETLGLHYQAYTTQIEPHDYLAEFFHALIRINLILIDLSRDCWGYISLEYFTQKMIAHETGSSTMPHKVNPIDFENAEGNLYLSNSILQCLAEKLPVSRFQRDLVDSTLLRNIGAGIGHALTAYKALYKGLDKIDINTKKISDELNLSWEILAEPVQMMLRAHGIENAYEKLKDLTRGKQTLTKESLHQFIDTLTLPAGDKERLKNLTPETYIGYAKELAESC
jgi:adenylosuccinate lyase